MRNCSLCISETNCASGTDTHANVRSYILGVPGEIRLSVSPNAPGVCVCVCVFVQVPMSNVRSIVLE